MPPKERHKKKNVNIDKGNEGNKVFVHDLTLDSEEEPGSELKSSGADIGKEKDENQDTKVRRKEPSSRTAKTTATGKLCQAPGKSNWKAKLSRNKKSSSQISKSSSTFQKIFEDDFLDRTDDFSGGCTPYKEIVKRHSSRNTKTNHPKKIAIRPQERENVDKSKLEPICDQPGLSSSQNSDCEGDGKPPTVCEASTPADLTDDEGCTKPVEPGEGLQHLLKCLRKYQRLPSASVLSESGPSTSSTHNKEVKGEIRSSIKDPDSRRKDHVVCHVCQQDISDLQVEGRLQHINSCLDSDGTKPLSGRHRSPTQKGPESPGTRCQICGQDLKQLNSYRRLQHINHCIDKTEESEKNNRRDEAVIKEARNKVLDCPICGQPLKTQVARKTHLKRCAVSFGVPSSVLIQRVKEQEEEYKIKLAAGIIPNDVRPDGKKPGRGRTRKKLSATAGLQNKRRMDSDTQLALALSTSLLEEEHRKNKLLNQDSVASNNEGSNMNAFSILMTPKPSKVYKKGRKKNRDERVPVLLLRTRDEVCQHIADRAAAMLVKQTSRDTPPTPPFPKSRVLDAKKNQTYRVYIQRRSCWRLASLKGVWDPAMVDQPDPDLTVSEEDAGFYVRQLMPPISPCKVKAGSKLRHMSSIPGYTEAHHGDGDSSKQVGELDNVTQSSGNKSLVASTQTAVYLAEMAEDALSTTLDLTDIDNITAAAVRASQDSAVSGGRGVALDEDTDGSAAQGFLTPKRPLLTPVSGSVTKVIDDLTTMVDNPLLSDLSIHTKDDVIKAHRFMLAARYPHLLKDICDESFLELRNFDGAAVRIVMRYIYTGSFNTSSAKLHQVAALASRWKLENLRRECLEMLEEEEEDGDDKGGTVPRSGASCADATLNNLLHQLWGSDYDDSDSDDSAADPRNPTDINKDLEPVYEYMATQKQKQRQRSEEEQSMSSEGEQVDEDGSTRDEEEEVRGIEPLSPGRSNYGSRLDLNMTHVDILTQLAALDDQQEDDEMEPGGGDEAGGMTEGTAEESDSEETLAIPMANSGDELEMEGCVAMETDSPVGNRSSSLTSNKHHLDNSKNSQNTRRVQLNTTQYNICPAQEQQRDASKSPVHSEDGVDVNLNMTTPSIVRTDTRSRDLRSEVTPDLFFASQQSPELHDRSVRQSMKANLEKTPKRQSSTTSSRVSQRSRTSIAESSGSELFDLSALEDSGCLNKTVFSGADEGLLSADVLSEAESDGCKTDEGRCVDFTPSPVFNSRQPRPLKSSQVVANLNKVFEANDSFNLMPCSQVLGIAALADVNDELNDSQSLKKDFTRKEHQTARATEKRKRRDDSQSDLEVPLNRSSRAQKRAKCDLENIGRSPRHDSISPQTPKSTQGPKGKIVNPRNPSYQEEIEVKSRSLEDESNKTDGYHDNAHPTGAAATEQDHDYFTISSDSDLDMVDLTQEIEPETDVPDIPEHEKSPASECQEGDRASFNQDPASDICSKDGHVWSDFDDAGYMDDFEPVLSAKSPGRSQTIMTRPEKKQMSQGRTGTVREQLSPDIRGRSDADQLSPDVRVRSDGEQLSPSHDTSVRLDGDRMSPVEEDYDPPTDIETDISIIADDAAVWHPTKIVTPKPPPKKKKKNTKNVKPPSPFTPMARYEDMATPELKQNCQKFGVRPLPKKKMLMTLKSIYQETHSYETDSEFEESFTTSRTIQRPDNGCPLQGYPLGGTGDTADNSPSDEDHSRSLQPPDVSDILEDDLPASQPLSQASTSSKPGGRDKAAQLKTKREKIRKYILEHRDLYLTILQYEPLEFDDFHRDLKEAGIMAGSDVVIDFLDEQNIQFTMRKHKEGDEEKGARGRGRSQRGGRGRGRATSAPRGQRRASQR